MSSAAPIGLRVCLDAHSALAARVLDRQLCCSPMLLCIEQGQADVMQTGAEQNPARSRFQKNIELELLAGSKVGRRA